MSAAQAPGARPMDPVTVPRRSNARIPRRLIILNRVPLRRYGS